MDLDNLCHTCGKTFSNYLLRSRHEIASHSGKLLGCTKCSYTAFGPKNLNNHMQKHQESQCSFCITTLPTTSLAKHKRICNDNPEQILIKCDQCPYETQRKDNLKRHVQSHSKISYAPKKIETMCRQVKKGVRSECGVCKKSFASKKSMMVHLNTLHMKKVINSSQGFGIWEETNKESLRKDPLICDWCNYTASQTSNLKRVL
jgi:hypothetical protein